MRPDDLNVWLAAANDRFRKEGVPHKQRPWRAVSEYTREFRISLSLGSPVLNEIMEFFEKNGPAGAQQIGSLLTNAFHFDSHFWPLHIPIGFGTFRMDPFACLGNMPDSVKAALRESTPDHVRFLLHWAECHDYAYGLSDMDSLSSASEGAAAFIRNADAKLRGAVAQLTLPSPNTYVALDLGFAAEIWMKALLIQEQKLTETQLKGFGHGIKKLAEECWELTGDEGFKGISNYAHLYPKVADRYDGDQPSDDLAWQALAMTTIAAACVIRRFSDRGMRAQVMGHLSQAAIR